MQTTFEYAYFVIYISLLRRNLVPLAKVEESKNIT